MIVDTAHHGADLAVHIHGHQRALGEAALAAFGRDLFAYDELGVFLHLVVDSGLHDHIALDVADIGSHQAFDPVSDIGFRTGDAGAHALIGVNLGGGGFFSGNIAFGRHGIERQALTLNGAFGAGFGVVGRWRGQNAGQHGGLSQRQIARRDTEIGLRGGLDAGCTGAEIDAVHIEFEDFFLGIVLFQPDGQNGFLHLAAQGLVGGEEQVLGHLLGDGGGTTGDATRLDHFKHNRGHADRIDAEMAHEAAVFAGDDGRGDIIGQLAIGHRFAAGLATIGDQAAISGQNADIGRPVGHGPGIG